MNTAADVRKLCDDVSIAIEQVRLVFRSTTLDEFETLTRFWSLKDNVCRLVQAVSDRRDETLELLRYEYASLISGVVDVIGFASKLRVGKIPAIATACQGINESLIALEYLKQSHPVGIAASA